MKLLALDTSSQSASCAVMDGDTLLGEYYTNVKLTHSQTILPMTQSLLEQTRQTLEEMDALAVTTGPGSFTGLRIGISAVKGMAFALQKPCVAVSTLEALAYGCADAGKYVLPVLDARCGQAYTALFSCNAKKPRREWPDMALRIEELAERLKSLRTEIFVVGDGARMCYNLFKEKGLPVLLPSACAEYTRAACVAQAAADAYARGGYVDAQALEPAYLRLPQAQRELLEKQRQAAEKDAAR